MFWIATPNASEQAKNIFIGWSIWIFAIKIATDIPSGILWKVKDRKIKCSLNVLSFFCMRKSISRKIKTPITIDIDVYKTFLYSSTK